MSSSIKKALLKSAEFMENTRIESFNKEFLDIWYLISEASEYQNKLIQSYFIIEKIWEF